MPTLQDVARRAGVSTATVSKVLSNTPYFTESTRQKVLSAVKELGYMPNLAARALSSGKTRVLAVVFPYVYASVFKDPLVMHILEGIEGECDKHNYNLLLSTPRLTREGPDEAYIHLLQSRYMDGLIAVDNLPLASAVTPARERNIPTVTIGYHESQYSVRSDDRLGGRMLAEHIITAGHRHVGVISVPENVNFAINERMRGIQETFEDAGVRCDTERIAYSDFSTTGGADATLRLLERIPDLSAVICVNDRMAMGSIQKLSSLQMRIPDDITVVGYDNIVASQLVAPALTTVDHHPLKLGQQAARMLFDLLDGKNPDSHVLSPKLIMRESSAHLRQAQ